jgi:hypothetical protein
MLKYADYVKKQQLLLCTCAVTIFFRTIWWDLIIANFCLELYVEVATRMRYYTNILLEKNSCTIGRRVLFFGNNDNSGPRGGGGV